MSATSAGQRYTSILNAPTKIRNQLIRGTTTAMVFRRPGSRVGMMLRLAAISRHAAVVFHGDAVAPTSSDASSSCRRRYLGGCAIAFQRAISTSLPSRCQLKVPPMRSGLSYCLSPVLNRAGPIKRRPGRACLYINEMRRGPFRWTEMHVATNVEGCVSKWLSRLLFFVHAGDKSQRNSSKFAPTSTFLLTSRAGKQICPCSAGIGQRRRGYR